MKQTQSRDSGQILPDVLVHGLDVVFCGSAAGSASAKARAYYAGRGNRFWPILHESGLTPRQMLPSEFRDAVQYGIGLTDLSKFQSGADSVLDPGGDDTGGLAEKITAYEPRVLTFNGKRAGSVFLHEIFAYNIKDYGLQPQALGTTALFVLPSTSGAARRWWDAAPWCALSEYLGR
jgi:TDG/mug DNA glycosylase family protein|tara:strand:+ start:209 stop:739 length:531 start_codon:yes stop_codon:yes gene_type:complete